MRTTVLRLTMALICLTLALQPIDARGRNDLSNRGRNATHTESKHNNRPRNQHNRPDNQHSRPNFGNHNGRPNNGHRSHIVNHHSHPNFNNGRYSHNYGRPIPPPPRPVMHNHRWHRPTPPPHYWHPVTTWRPFNTILGIALGSAINYTINSLINSGYNVCGYSNNAVYVTNVSMLGMMWPNATLVYSSNGLCGSEFTYNTIGYDMSRYYNAYNMLTSTYGCPYNVTNTGGFMTSTWWGNNNQFITLSFGNNNGSFVTTLSYGI